MSGNKEKKAGRPKKYTELELKEHRKIYMKNYMNKKYHEDEEFKKRELERTKKYYHLRKNIILY